MKERFFSQNQAQMGSRGESAPVKSKLIPIQSGLTPQANPYTLEGRMNDTGEQPKPSQIDVKPVDISPAKTPPLSEGQMMSTQTIDMLRALGAIKEAAKAEGRSEEEIAQIQADVFGRLIGLEDSQQEFQRQTDEVIRRIDDEDEFAQVRKIIEEEGPTFITKEDDGGVKGALDRKTLEEEWSKYYGKPLSKLTLGQQASTEHAIQIGKLPEIRGSALGVIDPGGIEDREIKGLIEEFNRRFKNRASPNIVEDMDRIALEISKRYRSEDFPPEERVRIEAKLEEIEKSVGEIVIGSRKERLQRTDPSHYFDEGQLKVMESRDPKDRDKREEIFNGIFKRADFNPTQEFSKVFSDFYDAPVYTAFIDYLQEHGLQAESNQFVLERQMRESTHNANYVVLQNIGSEQFIGFAQGLRDEHMDLAFRLKGVNNAMHAFEQAFLKVRAENGGFIPPEDVLDDPKTGKMGRVEQLARRYLINEIEQGLLEVEEKDEDGKTVFDKDGNVVIGGIPHDVDKNDWRINRAIAVSRGMGLLTGRIIEIAASSIIPKKNRYISLYAQKIIADLSPFRHIIGKFDPAREKNKIFSMILNRNKKLPWTYGELKEMTKDLMLDVANGFAEPGKEGKDRLISQLNPFGVGGAFTRSTWRTAEDDIEAGTTGDMRERGQADRKGTGVLIEANRSKLNNPEEKEEAEKTINDQLNKIEKTQPLRLFFNMSGLREQVLRKMDYKFDNEALERYVKTQAGTLGKDESSLTNKDRKKLRDKEEEIREAESKKFKYYIDLDGDIDELVVLQERYLRDEKEARNKVPPEKILLQLDFGTIGLKGDKRRDRIEKLAGEIKNVFKDGKDQEGRTFRNGFMDDLKNKPWRLPFNFGTEDVPYDEYEFSKLGSNAVARRWSDFANENKAVAATFKLMNSMSDIRTPEQAVALLKEIYEPIDQYDPTMSKEVASRFAEAVGKFFSKDYYSRLPGGLGTMIGMVKGSNSFAEASWGRGATSWDENEMNKFSILLRTAGIFDKKTQKEFQSRTIGGKVDVFKAFLRNYAQLGLLAVLFYIVKNAVKETK